MSKAGRGKSRGVNSVLPPKGRWSEPGMSAREEEDGPVLPHKDVRLKNRNVTVTLPNWLWDALDEIMNATNATIEEEEDHYSRNQVIRYFLENRVKAWRLEQEEKQGAAKGPGPKAGLPRKA